MNPIDSNRLFTPSSNDGNSVNNIRNDLSSDDFISTIINSIKTKEKQGEIQSLSCQDQTKQFNPDQIINIAKKIKDSTINLKENEHLLLIANELLQSNPQFLIDNFESFAINEKMTQELINLLNKYDKLLFFLRNIEKIQDSKIQLQIAIHLFNRYNPGYFSEQMQPFNLTESHQEEFIKLILNTSYWGNVDNNFILKLIKKEKAVDCILKFADNSKKIINIGDIGRIIEIFDEDEKNDLIKKLIEITNKKFIKLNEKYKVVNEEILLNQVQQYLLNPYEDLNVILSKCQLEEERVAMAFIYAIEKEDREKVYYSIRRFNISDQHALYSIFKMLLEKRMEKWKESYNNCALESINDLMDVLYEFGIKEDVYLSEILTILRPLPDFASKIKNLKSKIRDPNILFPFIIYVIKEERCINNDIETFVSYFEKNSDHIFQIAKQLLMSNPSNYSFFSTLLSNLNQDQNLALITLAKAQSLEKFMRIDWILDKQKYSEVMQQSATESPNEFCCYLNRNILSKLNPQQSLAFAKMTSEKNWKQFIWNFSAFNIQDVGELLQFARVIYDKQDVDVKQEDVYVGMYNFYTKQQEQVFLQCFKLAAQQASTEQEVSSIVKTMKELIKNEDTFLQLTNEIVRQNVLFLYHIDELNFRGSKRLHFAEQMLNENVKNFCQNIQYFHFSKEDRISLAKQAALRAPLVIAQYIDNFELAEEQKILNDIAILGLKENREEMKQWIGKFHTSMTALDEICIQEILTFIETKQEEHLQEKLFTCDPWLVEKYGKEMLKRGMEKKSEFEAHWACKFLEKSAQLYQRKGQLSQALELRLLLSQASLVYQDNPLTHLEEKLQTPFFIPSASGAINYGISLSHMGAQELKGQYFRVRDVCIDGTKKRIVNFKVAYGKGDEVRSNLRMLHDPQVKKQLEQKLGTAINLTENQPFHYLSSINGNYDSQQPNAVELGPVLTLDLAGLGKIQIGSDESWGSLINDVHITLESPTSLDQLQKVLAIIGLVTIMTPSTAEDIKRLKINKLIQFFYPKFAALNDRDFSYHEMPLSNLFEKLENEMGIGSTDKIDRYLDQLEFYDVLGGERHLRLKSFSDKAENWGARGLYTGVCGKEFKSSAEKLASILQLGFLATQVRYEAGLIIPGASPTQDFKANAADTVFARLATQSPLQSQEKILNNQKQLTYYIQLHISTEALNLMPYCHKTDNYGCRNIQTAVSRLKGIYENRPTVPHFVKDNQKTKWIPANEMMIKHYVDRKYIKAVIYRDPRRILLAEVQRKDSDFLGRELLQLKTDEERLNYLSQHPDMCREFLKKNSSDFNEEKDLYQGCSLLNHWLINPLECIQESLRQANIDSSTLLIQEAEQFNEKIFENSHHLAQRLEKVQGEVKTIAENFKASNLIGNEISDDSSKFIDEMRDYFCSLSEQELCEYLSLFPKAKQKLKKLQKLCQKYLENMSYSGQDSLNRQLLTSHWNIPLRDPEVILVLFAIEALKEKDSKNQDVISSIDFFVKTSSYGSKEERLISECLYAGLKVHHPVLLEKLPNNIKKKYAIDPQLEFLSEYVRRANIQDTFMPVLKAIHEAYEKLLHKKPSFKLQRDTQFNIPYQREKWKKEYKQILNDILNIIDKHTDQELLRLLAKQYSSDNLKKQALLGLDKLLNLEGCNACDMTVEEIIHKVTTSKFLLDFQVSHEFYDRLHILAALKSDDMRYSIQTKEGEVNMRTLMLSLIRHFTDHEISEDQAIAAEQFYIRLVLLQEKLMEKFPSSH